MSPISRRTPEPFCGCAPVSGLKRISSSRQASRPPTARSAAPEWIISTPSRSSGTARGGISTTWRRQEHRSPGAVHHRGNLSYLDYGYWPDDILLFGRESAGVPQEVHAAADARLVIPMRPGLRSLNVAVAARHGRWRGAAADRWDACRRFRGLSLSNCVYYVNIQTMLDLSQIIGFDWDEATAGKRAWTSITSAQREAEQVFLNSTANCIADDVKHSAEETRLSCLWPNIGWPSPASQRSRCVIIRR